MGRDREKSKHKHKSSKRKDRKEKDRKRRKDDSSDSTSSDSDSGREQRKKHKSEQLARKVVDHLQKTAKGPDAPFVWAKKVEKELGEGKKLKEISLFSDKNRQQERLDELEKVRKRQAEREAEKARREEELNMIQRMRAAQEAMDSEVKEQEFYLQSLLGKAERRLKESRPTPSDLIARNLHVGLRFGDTADFNLKEPWKYFEGLQLDDVQALYDDIKEYAEFDKYDPLHAEFWKALLEVAEFELAEAQKRDQVDRAHLRGGAEAAAAVAAQLAESESRLHSDVELDIHSMLKGQTYGELCSLEASMTASLEKGEGDPEYWQAVLSRLKIYKAKAHVRDIQARIVSATLQRLAQEAAEAAEEMGMSETETGSESEYSSGEDEDGKAAPPTGQVAAAAAGGGAPGGFGAGTAVAKAMGWAKEKRGVVRADVGAEGAAAANPEEIDLDGMDGEGTAGEGQGAAGGEGQEAAVAALGGPAVAGPAPAQVVYPSEVPGWRRRPRRRHRGDGPDPNDEARRVGGDAELPDEVIADGSMSPVLMSAEDVAGEGEIVHEEDDYRELELMRQQAKLQTQAKLHAARQQEQAMGAGPSNQDRSVRALLRDSGRVGVHPMNRHIAMQDGEGDRAFRAGIPENLSTEDQQTLAQFRSASAKVMGADAGDRDFGGEVPLEAQVYWWHDKYKPRKPKYFNRVHTGYEWNKYNQTHYDYDNPPPKVVQGYKFNILYHDLVDRTQTPQYVIERDPTSTDNSTCVIRFIAGAPYEDIAFRIVNKEWNYQRKHGFRCSFERGILHLFFNFKRTRYRR